MGDIKTGVVLSLKDLFSQNIGKAAGAAGNFAGKTLGAIEKVDKALSGTAAKLAAFGLTLSVGAAAKGIIEFDHRMTRLGLTANASAEQIHKMKQEIFDVSQASDVKLDPTNILSGLEVIMTRTGDLKYAEANVRNIGIAIQASGEAGESMGAVFSEFQKFGYSAEEISRLMDDMVAQSDQGAFTFAEFARNAPAVFSAYSAIGTAPENIRKANAAMQILVAGTRSPEEAVTALSMAMSELSDPDKQKKLRQLGIRVRDSTGKFRDFNDIMFDIVAKAKQMGNADFFGTIFGERSMKAVRSYMNQGERMYDNLVNLGDTTGLLQKKSATMAGTLQSNIRNLQTAFSRFADSNLSKPLSDLTELLNKLAEDPEKLKKIFTGIAVGIGAIAAIKGIAGITRMIGSLAQLKGGKINIAESLSMASAMPVYVTNWGGAPGMPGMTSGMPNHAGAGSPYQSLPLGGTPLANARTAVANIRPGQYAASAGAAGIGAAFIAIPNMVNELEQIKQNEELTAKERGKAEGGAIGDATGSIVGAAAGGAAGIAAGAAVGAAVGSVVPVLGTAVGALVGAGIGALGMWLGGKAGRAVGEGIGEAIADDKPRQEPSWPENPAWQSAMANAYMTRIPSSRLPPEMLQARSIEPQKVDFGGQADMNVNINLAGDRPTATVAFMNNTTPIRFNPGSAPIARMMNP